MKTTWKIAALAALVFPLTALSANAAKKKPVNYYKTSITGYMYVQTSDDYKKEKLKTNDVIDWVIAQLGLEDEWKAKDCEIVMELSTDDDALSLINWWIHHKDRSTTQKARIDSMIALEKSARYASAIKIKFTAKNDNEKAQSEFVFADFSVDADGNQITASVEGSADISLRGVNTLPFLENAKVKSQGQMVANGSEPGSIDVKVKGKISNDDFDDAQDVTPID